jgi:hypothetical protein
MKRENQIKFQIKTQQDEIITLADGSQDSSSLPMIISQIHSHSIFFRVFEHSVEIEEMEKS